MQKHEIASKKYPARFPNNSEVIGIELVGKFIGDDATGSYEKVTIKQQQSLDWLIGALLIAFHLTRADIYRHSEVSRKMKSEAANATF